MNVLAEELRVDARLAHDEPELPGLLTVLDEVLLRRWAADHGVRADLRVDRLRHKSGTSLRAALTDGGSWWLLTAHSRETWRKAGKDVHAVAKVAGRSVVDEDLRLVLTPAVADRALPWLRRLDRHSRIVAHNPARRSVLHDEQAGRCRKVHADAHVAAVSVRASQLLRRNAIATPSAELDGRHVVSSTWVPGRSATPADEAAVQDLVRRWNVLDPAGLPVLGSRELRAAVRRAVAGTHDLGVEFTDRLRRTVSRW